MNGFMMLIPRRKPALKCTPANLAAYGLAPDAISQNNPDTLGETITRDMLPDRFRAAQEGNK